MTKRFTDAQILAALEQANGHRKKAADILSCPERHVYSRLSEMRAAGSYTQGVYETQPAGHVVKGVSSLIGDDGSVRAQWVKTNLDAEAQKTAQELFVKELTKTVRGLARPVPKPKAGLGDLMSTYVIGDAHFGMLALKAETLEADFDLKIAERELTAAISYLVDTAPKSKYGLLVDVGDFMHVNDRKNVTPQSGNLLDVDTRFSKLIRVVVLVFRFCIQEMLKKHEKVKVIASPGNHNPDSAGWVSLCLDMFYENEPRVEVDTSPSTFFYHRFGKSLIGVTHGDRTKFADLPSIMAADRPKDWGDTEHRHFLCGHVHHTKQQEFRGCFVESFNTLAPNDAWHTQSGYRSKRQIQRLDFHRDNGIVSRFNCNVGML